MDKGYFDDFGQLKTTKGKIFPAQGMDASKAPLFPQIIASLSELLSNACSCPDLGGACKPLLYAVLFSSFNPYEPSIVMSLQLFQLERSPQPFACKACSD